MLVSLAPFAKTIIAALESSGRRRFHMQPKVICILECVCDEQRGALIFRSCPSRVILQDLEGFFSAEATV